MRCDFCSVFVDRAWFYPHNSFIFNWHGQLIDAQQGQAAACDECQVFVETNDITGLTARSAAIISPEATDLLIEFQSRILANITGPPVLTYADEPVERPLLIENTCPLCGHLFQHDRRKAVNSTIETVCPSCNLPVRIAAINPPTGWNK